LLEDAYELPEINAVALIINSPGGTPVQAALIANKIRDLSKANKVKTYAFIEDVAASGGYWLACAADEIYVQDASIIGSIGVVSAGFGFDKLIEKHNIERRVYTAGDNKTMLDPFQPEKPADVKRIKAIQKDIHNQFIDWVKLRRGDKLKGSDKKLFNGDVWVGDQAIELGLVDGGAEMQAFMKKKFGKQAKFIHFANYKGMLANLMGTKKNIEPSEVIETLDTYLNWNRFLNK
jgi:signal peptide peptidase SppA